MNASWSCIVVHLVDVGHIGLTIATWALTETTEEPTQTSACWLVCYRFQSFIAGIADTTSDTIVNFPIKINQKMTVPKFNIFITQHLFRNISNMVFWWELLKETCVYGANATWVDWCHTQLTIINSHNKNKNVQFLFTVVHVPISNTKVLHK